MHVGSPVYLVLVCFDPGGNDGFSPPFQMKSPDFFLCLSGWQCPNLSDLESENVIFPKTGEKHDFVRMRGDSSVNGIFRMDE